MFAQLSTSLSVCLAFLVSQIRNQRNRKAFVKGLFVTLLAHLFVGSWGFAAGLTVISTRICGWAPTVANVMLALAFIVFIVGLGFIAFGNRDGVGRTTWAVIGSIALAGAAALFTALTGTTCLGGGA